MDGESHPIQYKLENGQPVLQLRHKGKLIEAESRHQQTSASPSISIEHVQVAQIEKNTMTVDILISAESLGQKKIVEATTLLDTGAGGKFINQNFVQDQKIETKELKYPIEVFNVDGTPNKQETITKYT
jgi:Retroviral aspartyl protease